MTTSNLGRALMALVLLAPAVACARRAELGSRGMGGSPLDDDEGQRSSVPLPPGARVLRDVSYGPDPAQRFDVYMPEKARGAPVIFLVHGGGWFRGDKAMGGVVDNKVARWLPKGFVVISTNYRMIPAAPPLEQANDVARAIAFAQAHAGDWGASGTQFVAMGHSAGAHLVALLAADDAPLVAAGAKPLLGVVSLDSAAMDVSEIMQGPHFRLYDRAFGSSPEVWRAASPLQRMSKKPVPLLMVCSSRRRDSCPQATALAQKAESLGGRATVLPVDLSHREINVDLGVDGDYTERVEAFIRSLALAI